MSTNLSYRLRIRNAADNADALIISSVRGGTNPYIAEPPSGDGQEVDPLLGSVRTGVYTIRVVDAITSGTSRVFTSQLFDTAGRQLLLSRRSYIELSTDGGSTWALLVAGYLLNYNLTDAITWEIQVGDTRRIEQTKQVFDGTSVNFAKRGCIFGGPICGGGWGPINDRGGFASQVLYITATDGGGHIVRYGLAAGYRGINDPMTNNIQNVLGVTKDDHGTGFVGQATVSFYLSSVAPYAIPGYGTQDANGNPLTGLSAFIKELAAGPTRGLFTPAAFVVTQPGPAVLELVDLQLVGPFQGTNYGLLWPAGVALPTVGDIHHIALFTTTASDQSPVYLDLHPVDIVTTLWTEAGIAYDAPSAAAVRTLLGSTLRVAMRITKSTTLLDFLEQSIFGPFGISARVGLVTGVLELFTTRLKQTATPTTTIGTNDLQDASGVVFGNDEQTIVSSVRFKTETYWAYPSNAQPATTATQPLDSVMVAQSEVAIVNSDANALVTNEIVYEFQGMIHDVSGINTDMVAMTTSVAVEMFDRFGRGAPVTDAIAVLRGSDTGFQIGDEVYLEPAHFPNLNKRFGDDPSVGARIMQVLRRTESPAGPIVKLIDAGSAQQPVTPAAVITIAASSGSPRISALFTVTNAAAINATGVLITAIQWATGGASPANGVQFARYVAGTTPTGAVQLPAVVPGTQVWVRARTEQDGRRPSAWTAWVSVTLAGVPSTGVVNFNTGGFRSLQVVWTFPNNTDLADIFIAKPPSIASTAIVAGHAYMIDAAGSTNWIALGAAFNTEGTFFTATGSGAGTGTAMEVPATWDAYLVVTVPPGGPTYSGSSAVNVDTPPPGGFGILYICAMSLRDPATGERGPLYIASGGTSNQTTTAGAPRINAINSAPQNQGSLLSGVTLALYRSSTLDLRIQRAPDAAGVPGTWADLITVRGSTETYTDYLPSGQSYWYRLTHDGPSNTPSYSSALFATAQSVPPLLQPPAYSVNNGVMVGFSADALGIAVANLAGSGAIELGANETVTIAADLAVPVGVTLRGLSGAAKSIIQGVGGARILRLTGAPATQRGGRIENLVFDNVALLLGDTTADYGVGSTLKGLEIKNVVGYALTYRNNSYLTVADDVMIHDCTNGILFDFGSALSSGAAMVVRGSKIFNVASAVIVSGNTADGHDIWIESTDLEHTTVAGLNVIASGEGRIQLRDVHFELNTGYHVINDGSHVFLDGFWALSSTELAWFWSKSGTLFAKGARGNWNANMFAKMTGGLILFTPDEVFCAARPWGTGVTEMATASSTAGMIVGPRSPYAARSAITLLTMSDTNPNWPTDALQAAKFDGNERVWELTVECVAVTTDNTLRVEMANGHSGPLRCDVHFPLFVGIARLKITYVVGGTLTVSGIYSGTTPGATTTQGIFVRSTDIYNTVADDRYLVFTTIKFGTTCATMSITDLWEYVSGPKVVGL